MTIPKNQQVKGSLNPRSVVEENYGDTVDEEQPSSDARISEDPLSPPSLDGESVNDDDIPQVVFPPPPRDGNATSRVAGPICLGVVLNTSKDQETGKIETSHSPCYLLRKPHSMPSLTSQLLYHTEFLVGICEELWRMTLCPFQPGSTWCETLLGTLFVLILVPFLMVVSLPLQMVTAVLSLLCAIVYDLIVCLGKSSTGGEDDYKVYKSIFGPSRRRGCLAHMFLEDQWEEIPAMVESATNHIDKDEKHVRITVRFYKQQEEGLVSEERNAFRYEQIIPQSDRIRLHIARRTRQSNTNS